MAVAAFSDLEESISDLQGSRSEPAFGACTYTRYPPKESKQGGRWVNRNFLFEQKNEEKSEHATCFDDHVNERACCSGVDQE